MKFNIFGERERKSIFFTEKKLIQGNVDIFIFEDKVEINYCKAKVPLLYFPYLDSFILTVPLEQ